MVRKVQQLFIEKERFWKFMTRHSHGWCAVVQRGSLKHVAQLSPITSYTWYAGHVRSKMELEQEWIELKINLN